MLSSPSRAASVPEFARLTAGGKGIRTSSPTVVFELADSNRWSPLENGTADRDGLSASSALLRRRSLDRTCTGRSVLVAGTGLHAHSGLPRARLLAPARYASPTRTPDVAIVFFQDEAVRRPFDGGGQQSTLMRCFVSWTPPGSHRVTIGVPGALFESHLPAAGGPPVEGDYDEGYGGCAI